MGGVLEEKKKIYRGLWLQSGLLEKLTDLWVAEKENVTKIRNLLWVKN